MKLETINAHFTILPSSAVRRAGDVGAALPHGQTIAGNMAEILEA